jgi:hypothetical protein
MLLNTDNGWSCRGDLKVLLQSDQAQRVLSQLLVEVVCHRRFLVLNGSNIKSLDHDAGTAVEIAPTA